MRFPSINRGEKKVLIAVSMLACFIGSVAAFVAYSNEAEAQFHGGVLEEDIADADFSLFWESVSAFAQWSIGSYLIIGVAPIVVRRLLLRGRSNV